MTTLKRMYAQGPDSGRCAVSSTGSVLWIVLFAYFLAGLSTMCTDWCSRLVDQKLSTLESSWVDNTCIGYVKNDPL